MRIGRTFEGSNRADWRDWLERHHQSEAEVWVVYHNQASGRPSLDYAESVEEALCFGWIDGLIKKHGPTSHARRFTPRKPKSMWSALNLERYARMEKAGLVAAAGRAAGPTAATRAYVPMAQRQVSMPAELEAALARSAKARAGFEALPPGQRRTTLVWVADAKQAATRAKRADLLRRLLAAGMTLEDHLRGKRLPERRVSAPERGRKPRG